MRKTIGRSVAAAVLAAVTIVPVAGVAQAAPKAPAAMSWKDKCDCKKGHHHDDDDWGRWGHWGGGLLSDLLRILL
ncbi:hypothetical protein ABZ840_35595 [Streptomyces sp. NPDC047117]|uniref:hypothetical protein n=1 Tax=unclassified Streptomyces TaxID=2593676 RepID=UPI0033D9D2FC